MSIPTPPTAAALDRTLPPPGFWQRFSRNRIAIVSLVLLLLLAAIAVLAPVLAPYGYAQQNWETRLEGPSASHLLGTDELGRDTLSRAMHGTRIALIVVLAVEGTLLVLGMLVGLTAGFVGGWVETGLMRLTDVMLAFPDVLLAILLVGIFGASASSAQTSLLLVILALGVTGWPPLARLIRGQVLMLRNREFVEAARSLGAANGWIVRRHILPNLLSPLIVAITIDAAGVILAEATLSFLGIGVQRPYPSWGRMINDALEYYQTAPRLLIVPSVALSVTVIALNFVGDGLRDALDPRANRS